LHNLTCKGATFSWTSECETAFQELKQALTSTPMLVAPCDSGQYVLDTDASDTALGAVLQQVQGDKVHVIGYASRTLNPSQARYCITRRELLGVVFGLKKFRQYLLGPKIIVRTDHAALAYLMNTREPIGQQGRWLDLFGQYDITIQHRPGRAHGNCNALSRRPCERGNQTRCQQCTRATPSLTADPVVCEVLPVDSSSELPAPVRFKLLYSHADTSMDLSIAHGTLDIASDHLEVPVLPVSTDEATHTSPPNDVTARAQVLGVTAEPASISLDDIRDAQSVDDNLQPVTQGLTAKVKPPQGSLREHPEEARILFSQWDSLVLEDDVLYRRYHYSDGTTKYLQVVLPVKLRRSYIERLHADLGHFDRTKTCLEFARCAYFPGWRSLAGMLPATCISEAIKGHVRLL